jgi:hypothetical protein
VLFTGLFPMYHYHFCVELELLQDHLYAGDRVSLLECHASLQSCTCNPERHLHHCARCIGIRQDGVRLIEGKVARLPLIDGARKDKPLLDFQDLAELKAYEIDFFDIGMAVFSSLVDYTKDTSPDIEKHATIMQRLLMDAYSSYHSALHYLSSGKFDLVYVFNGRFAAARPWIRICEHLQIPYITHERGGVLADYSVFRNELPHDPSKFPARISQLWDEAETRFPGLDKVAEGSRFFTDRRAGVISNWKPFVENSDQDLMPPGFDNAHKNIAIFASTEGELAGLAGFFRPSFFTNQLEGILFVAGQLAKEEPMTRFYLRLHPNSRNEKSHWWLDERLHQLSNLTMIEIESPISSYTLLRACDVTVTFGSGMGVEATYWGKPSILASDAWYRNCGTAYQPESKEELLGFLRTIPEPLSQENATRCGFYMRKRGHPMKYSEVTNYYTLKFRGVYLDANLPVHQWLGQCEKRSPVSGLRKWLQDRSDRSEFHKLWKKCDGWFAKSPKK